MRDPLQLCLTESPNLPAFLKYKSTATFPTVQTTDLPLPSLGSTMASKLFASVLITLLISILTKANATSRAYVPLGALCRDFTIPVKVESENFPWIAPKWTDDFDFIDFASTASSRRDAGFPPPIGPPASQTANYEISATFCTPKASGKKAKTVLLATHGLAFDRR